MQRELLIGLAGIKGSGKSTVATILADMIPNVEIVAWADALKDEVAEIVEMRTSYHAKRYEIEALKGEVYGPILQGWGALRRHYFGEDYWIRQWDERAPDRVIVPDCRHHNEVEFLKSNGGVLIYIDGPSRWEGDTRSSSHESEKYIPDLRTKATYTIDNKGSLDSLRDQVELLADILAEADQRVASTA